MPPRRRRPPQEFIADITVEDDGIRPFRSAHELSRDKLGILASYISAYGNACKSAGDFYFIDGLAGSGLYYIEETKEWLLGSTPIAVRSMPAFAKCLALEFSAASAEALMLRTRQFGSRVMVRRGDCNSDLLPLMESGIATSQRHKPMFVLLDPEGFELHWTTVKELSRFRRGAKKSELLILVASASMPRLLPASGDVELHNEMRLNRFMPPDSGWRGIWESRLSDSITPAEAIERYVESYRHALEHVLQYKTAILRDIRRTSGQLLYHLIFATDDDTGSKIMTDVFGSMHSNRPQLKLL
jgi:three-Cys-motif partner protein